MGDGTPKYGLPQRFEITAAEFSQRIMNTPLFSCTDVHISPQNAMALLYDGTILPSAYSVPVHTTSVGAPPLPRALPSVPSLGTLTPAYTMLDLYSAFTQVPITTELELPPSASMDPAPIAQLSFDLVDTLISTRVAHSEDTGSRIHRLTRGLPFIEPANRATTRLGVAMADNRQSAITIGGIAPRIVLMDTGAQPVIMSHWFAQTIGLTGAAIRPSTSLANPYYRW